ncbi:MAG: NAD(P)H-hydrate dehydratase [Lachnospiraceae bacterium]|nr:NAD(P)H-hydrate dehydratase [Lachnospiraceae bacterium]
MQYVVNSQEMKQFDKNTIEYYGVPSMVLMERAALAVFEEIKLNCPDKNKKMLIICGAGNNGGDGFAIARLLHLNGYFVEILFPMDESKMTNETSKQYEIVKRYGISVHTHLVTFGYDVIVDALFGIGLCREIGGELKAVIDAANQTDALRIAADIPSGISADTGEVLGVAFEADITVTFGFAKIGQLLCPGAQYCGRLIVADIGIDNQSILEQTPQGKYLVQTDILELLPSRKAYSNKGSYGKVLVIAGSKNMAGAAYLSAKAAYYSGCGLVRILTAKENREILLTRLPEAILTTYDTEQIDIQQIQECIHWADAVLIGPGIGTEESAKILVKAVLEAKDMPVVFDADALNILAKEPEYKKMLGENHIITPHLGEMSRLIGKSIKEIQKNLIAAAREFAKEHNTICILKDARTIIALADGKWYINISGNNGMATGGSGDVLAGLVTGFAVQSGKLGMTAAFACFVHGRAGDFAKIKKGAHSMLASDILEQLPNVLNDKSKE